MLSYVIIAVVIAAIYFSDGSNDGNYVKDEIDLNRVLDVTVSSIENYQKELDAQPTPPADPDQAFIGFSQTLQTDYNAAQPPIYTGSTIGVSPQNDASLLAYADTNNDAQLNEGEQLLFLIEIDGEKNRIIASSRSGAVNDHYFSGTSLLAGYLIGSMLSRQRVAGVNPKSLSSKTPVTAKAAARARAGSGSYSSGK